MPLVYDDEKKPAAGGGRLVYDDAPNAGGGAEPSRTWAEVGTDLGAGALKGALSVAKLGALAGDKLTYDEGFNNPAVRFIDEFGASVDANKSAKLRAAEQRSQEATARAGKAAQAAVGEGAAGTAARVATEFGVGAWQAVKDPALLANALAEQVPMLGAMGAGARLAGAGTKAALTAAPALAATRAGAVAAAGAGTAGAVGTGMALQGTDIAGDVFNRLMALPDEVWAENVDFAALAKEIGVGAAKVEIAGREARSAGAKAALASGLTSMLPGGAAIERAVAGKGGMSMRAVPKAIVGEARQEGLEEGFGALYANQAVGGIDPKQDLAANVGGSAGQGAALGGIMGGGMTAARAAPSLAMPDVAGALKKATAAAGGAINADEVLGQVNADPAQPGQPALDGEAAVRAAPGPAPSAAETALLTPRALTSLDRVDAIDRELAAKPPEAADAPEVQALQAERAAITKDWPAAAPGAETSFTTEAGARLGARYALMDADALVTSHDTSLRANPAYPAELQPRERERAASAAQISGIVQKLDPARLGLSADAATGAPIVGADGLVESGNARTIALKRVYQANGQNAEDYKAFLRANASQFGITPESVDSMAKPVLVRVRSTPVNRAEFARQANASTVAAMSPAEQARSDAKRIDAMDDLNPTEEGDFSSSRDFIRRFVGRLPKTEQGAMQDAGGALSSAGYARVRNAVLAKAYGDSPVLTRMVESMDDNLRNVSRALMIAAPQVAQARQAIGEGRRFDADITPHLVSAVEELGRLRDAGTSVDDALAQAGLMGETYTPETREVLRFLADNARRPRKMAEFIGAYFDALDAAGDPAQVSLLGDVQAPSTTDLMAAARRTIAGDTNAAVATNPERAVDREAAPDRAGAGRQPGDAPGNRGGDQGDGVARAAANDQGPQEWVNFGPETGTLGIPRAQMPQVKVKLRPALYDFLKARGIGHEVAEAPAASLKPTQAEYSTVKAANASTLEGEKAQVLVSSDGYVLDGHHRWVGKAMANEPVQTVRFDAPIDQLLDAVREFSGTTTSNESVTLREIRAAQVEKFYDAAADLAQIMSKHTRAAMVREDTKDLMPTLVKLFTEAIKIVGTDMKRATAWVKSRLKVMPEFKTTWNKIGDDVLRKAALQAVEAGPADDLMSAPKAGVVVIDGVEHDATALNFGFRPWPRPLPDGDPLLRNTNKLATTPDGKPRSELRNRIVEDHFAGVAPVTGRRPIITMMGGGGASGKGTIKAQLILAGKISVTGAISLDADEIKKAIPEYRLLTTEGDSRAAAVVHEESSEINKTILRRAKRGGYDLVYDVTMGNPVGGKDLINEMKKAGYEVRLIGVTVDPAWAIARAQKRARESGRYVPLQELLKAHKGFMAGFPEYAALVDDVLLLDNTTAPLALALTGEAGTLQIKDKDAYNEAVRRAGSINVQADTFEAISGVPAGTGTDVAESDGAGGDRVGSRGHGAPDRGGVQDGAGITGEGAGAGASTQDGSFADRAQGSRRNDGGLNVNPAQNGRAGAEGEGPGAAQGTGRRRQAELVPGQTHQSDLFGLGGLDDAAADAPGLGQAGPAGVRAPDENRPRNEPRSGARGRAGVPAGRDIAAKSGRNFRFGDDDVSQAGSWQRKAAANVDAVELLKALQAANDGAGRQATLAEQATLAKFIGWGASDIANNLAALLGDKRPKVEGGSRKIVVTPKTAGYAAYQKVLAQRIEISKAWKPSKSEPNNPDPIIKIIGDGRLAAIDVRFMDPSHESEPDSKLNKLADGVIAAFHQTADLEYHGKDGKVEPAKGASMMVFSDLGFGAGVTERRGFNAKAWFEKRLRDGGVPPGKVAWMSDYKKSIAKLKLFGDVNAGRVRILIGSSKNMGTGVNAQQRLAALFHLDSPWFPADLEQREGRGVRTGNKNKTIALYGYAAKGSFDEPMWAGMARKQLFIDAAMSGDESVREIEDLDAASQMEQAAALVAEDPRILQLAGDRAEIGKLERLYAAHEDSRQRFRKEHAMAQITADFNAQRLGAAEDLAGKIPDLSGDKFTAKVGKIDVTDRTKWGMGLLAMHKELTARVADTVQIGEIAGFPVNFTSHKGAAEYTSAVILQVPSRTVLISDGLEPPIGVASRAINGVVAVQREPQIMREAITAARSKMDALAGRLQAPFPMAQLLADKRQAVMALEAELAAESKPRKFRAERVDTNLGHEVTATSVADAIDKAVASNGGTPADWRAFEPAPGAPPAPEGTLLSRGGAGGIAINDLDAVKARVVKAMPGMPPVHVLASPAYAPADLRDYIEQRGAMRDVEGALHKGEIYLFASGIRDAERAEHVLAEHEAAHFGLRAILGNALPQQMQAIFNLNVKVRRAVAAMLEREPEMSLAHAVEEVLVDMPTSELIKLQGWRALVGKAVQWMAAHGFEITATKLSRWLKGTLSQQDQADLFVANLVRDARAFVARKNVGGDMTAATPMFSRSRQADTAEFKAFFRKSRVTEDGTIGGKPRVMYHATVADFNAFKSMSWDIGMHFGTKGQAEDRAAVKVEGRDERDQISTMPVYLRIENPLRLDDEGTWTFSTMRAALADKLPLSAKKIATLKNLEQIRAWLESNGIDGIVYRNTGESAEGPRLRAAIAKAERALIGKSLFAEERAEVERLKLAYDIHKQKNAEDSYIVFRPEQIKSALGNSGAFDPANPDIRLSTAATSGPAPARTATERAEDLIHASAGTPMPLDATVKALTRVTGVTKGASMVYGLGAKLIDRITPERMKAGVVSDYGVPDAVIDQRAMMQGRQREQLRGAGALLEKLATLTRAESRVAYEWMNMDGADPKAYVSMMQGLPEESVKVLQEVQQMIDKLSQEAVRLGQLDADTFTRNRFAYLRRSYFKHASEMRAGDRAKTKRAIALLGDQYKGRGMTGMAPMKQIQNVAPDWWKRKTVDGKADTSLKGEKFVRMERRAPSGERTAVLPGVQGDKTPGRLLEVHYVPAGVTMPAKYADWTSAGTWEARDTKGADVVMWRDFTKDEREKMGEIDEARFAIAKTLHAMIHDIEVGRYMEWLAQGYAKKPGEQIIGTVVEASERYRDTFTAGEWVQVPDVKIPGTSVARYGKLAGQYLPGPIWNDLRQVVGGRFQPLGETYDRLLTMWKLSKTALSPAVHMNNVMSNFVMADWHDVSAGHVAKALRIILGASKRDGQGLIGRAGNAAARLGHVDHEAATEILARYQNSGGAIGGWVTQEIRNDQLEPIVAALQRELEGAAAAAGPGEIGIMSAVQHLMHARFPQAFKALSMSKPVGHVSTEMKNLIDLYQSEDEFFRLAAWLKAKEDGKSDAEAGKVARRSFLDYSINAPWIQAMRSTAFPFISFTYRALPMLLETAGKRPHKLIKLMAVAGALNWLGVMIGGGGDDKERKLLPEEKAGGVWGLVPKLVRLPWNDTNGSPVYLDIRRWIPVGDVADLGQGHSALPLPPALMPGGPLAMLGEVVLNKTAFTGKPITLETDTATEKAGKVADYLWKALMPNVLGVPGTYATQGVADAVGGRTDAFGRQQSVAQALASSVGVKVGSYPEDVLRRNLMGKHRAEEMEIDRVIGDLKRQRQTNRIDADEFTQKVQAQQAKKVALQRELMEKMN